jgi:hypothetical protein
MLLARYHDISQRAASIRDALAQIDKHLTTNGKKRKRPTKSAAPTPTEPSLQDDDGKGDTADVDPTKLQAAFTEHSPDKVITVFQDTRWKPADLREIARGLEELADKLEDEPPDDKPVDAKPAVAAMH